ncbi:hypothetical protein ACP3TJ_05240 [Desulforudis sp. 1088]|uniref:hypothetical protein n=1 Tax=unclassified Candidatus Desulforudis TaxID=2635950 RepID=UPI003484E9C3
MTEGNGKRQRLFSGGNLLFILLVILLASRDQAFETKLETIAQISLTTKDTICKIRDNVNSIQDLMTAASALQGKRR